MLLIKIRISLLVAGSFFSTDLIFSVSFTGYHNILRTCSIGILYRSNFISVDFKVLVDDKEFKMSWWFDENFVKLNPPFDNNCLAFIDTFTDSSLSENKSR